jgi:hypothetical protein
VRTGYVPPGTQRALVGIEHDVVHGELGVAWISRLRTWTGVVGEGRSAHYSHRH